MNNHRQHQRGFAAITAIVVLVILATLSAAIVAISSTQHIGVAQDVLSARAWQTARAGNEWGLYQALKGRDWAGAATTCDTASRTATLNLSTDTGLYVTVYCDSWLYNEGESTPGVVQTKRVYRISSVACPTATGCPASDASVAAIGYVERTRTAMAVN
ncbi:hypothetical protein [Propionivibrio sp.]|uniref:hypothetical protein n=1 Tax=Propionivibrio sp. TaxID=2212460 RepID=UPI002620B0C4|nr:hypothetical protein [Propionivibrio sp.]